MLLVEVDITWNVQTTDLRRRVRAVLDHVRLQREPVIIHNYNTPQAVIIPYEDFAEYQTWRTQRQKRAAWLAELKSIAEEVSARAALTEDKADALIQEAPHSCRFSQ